MKHSLKDKWLHTVLLLPMLVFSLLLVLLTLIDAYWRPLFDFDLENLPAWARAVISVLILVFLPASLHYDRHYIENRRLFRLWAAVYSGLLILLTALLWL